MTTTCGGAAVKPEEPAEHGKEQDDGTEQKGDHGRKAPGVRGVEAKIDHQKRQNQQSAA